MPVQKNFCNNTSYASKSKPELNPSHVCAKELLQQTPAMHPTANLN